MEWTPLGAWIFILICLGIVTILQWQIDKDKNNE